VRAGKTSDMVLVVCRTLIGKKIFFPKKGFFFRPPFFFETQSLGRQVGDLVVGGSSPIAPANLFRPMMMWLHPFGQQTNLLSCGRPCKAEAEVKSLPANVELLACGSL